MLPSDQIDALREVAGQLMDPVVKFLIEEIAERVKTAGQLTSTAAYQTWILQQMGVGQKKLKQELAKKLGLTREEIGKLMKQAAKVGYDFDLSRFPTSAAIPFEENTSIQQILAAAIALADDDFTNLTRTMGFVSHDGKVDELTDAYRKACDFAFEKVVTGAQDYNSAVRQAVKGLADKGIFTIDYKSGTHRSIEVAVRDSVLGGLGLMDEKICQQNHDDLGCDGWEISAHRASAPDHEPIQGKQYTDAQYKSLNNSLRRRIGTLHCGHSAMGIIMGVNDPQYTPEELEELRRENEEGVTYDGQQMTLYQATQRQRSLERKIRKQKKNILLDEALGDEEQLQTDQIRYQVLSQEYKRFSKATGQKLRHERLEAAGFGPKQAKAAEGKGTLDQKQSKQYNIHADREQFDRYQSTLRELSPSSFEDFQKVKYEDPSKWSELKYQYRTLNRYEVEGDISAKMMLDLDHAAWHTKQTGFDYEPHTGKTKKRIRNLNSQGNAAAMSIDGKLYFAHSRVSEISDLGYLAYKGEYPLVTLKKDRKFSVLDLGDDVPRFHDTEAKFLEYVAGIKTPDDTFEVTILSEKHICKSCEHVVGQFKEMFPNSTVNIVSGKRNYNNSEEGLKTWLHRKKVKSDA